MWAALAKVLNWILNMWGALPESTKAKVYSTVADSAESMLRKFYKSFQEKSGQAASEVATNG